MVFSDKRLAESIEDLVPGGSRRLHRKLEVKEVDEDLTIYGTISHKSIVKEGLDGLTVFIHASEMSDKERLNFEYSIDEFSETDLKINIFFQNPTSVSTTHEKD